MLRKFADRVGYNNVRKDEPLSNHTTFRIGGPADYMVTPRTERDIAATVDVCRNEGLPFIVVGNGSNILFSDKGFRGVVIQLGEYYSGVEFLPELGNTTRIYAKAGTLLSRVSSFACDHELSGLEFASGIPGSVGGAVLMNAGAYDGEISQCLIESRSLDLNAIKDRKSAFLKRRRGEEHCFSYRHSVYQDENEIILGAVFELKTGDSREEIVSRIRLLNSKRREKQPLELPSAGSVFKRPVGDYAARLIELSGLKGYRVGDAMVSDKHAGFIVNVGEATCDDVLRVIEYVQSVVLKQHNISLEPEIRIIKEQGEWIL